MRVSRNTVKYIGILILILVTVISAFNYFQPSREWKSFQDFAYPSTVDFREILSSNNTELLPKIFDYEPQILNGVTPINLQHQKVIVYVKSALENFQKRQNIRRSWSSPDCRKAHRFQVFFVLGMVDEVSVEKNNLQKQIEREISSNGDILQFNFHDNYYNNTYKLIAIMDYFVLNNFHIPFLAIVDDDYFINPPVLMATVLYQISKKEISQFVGGFVFYHNKAIRSRNNKWHISYDEYPYEFYPPYITGGFTLMSNVLVKKCRRLFPYLRYLRFDDVLLGILLFKLRIYPTHMTIFNDQVDNRILNSSLAIHECNENCLETWIKNKLPGKC